MSDRLPAWMPPLIARAVSSGMVRYIERGVSGIETIEGTKGAPKGKSWGQPSKHRPAIAAALRAGVSAAQIARDLNISTATVYYHARRLR